MRRRRRTSTSSPQTLRRNRGQENLELSRQPQEHGSYRARCRRQRRGGGSTRLAGRRASPATPPWALIPAEELCVHRVPSAFCYGFCVRFPLVSSQTSRSEELIFGTFPFGVCKVTRRRGGELGLSQTRRLASLRTPGSFALHQSRS